MNRDTTGLVSIRLENWVSSCISQADPSISLVPVNYNALLPSRPMTVQGSMIGVDHSAHKYSTFCHHASPAFHLRPPPGVNICGAWSYLSSSPVYNFLFSLSCSDGCQLTDHLHLTHPRSSKVPPNSHGSNPVRRADLQERRSPTVSQGYKEYDCHYYDDDE